MTNLETPVVSIIVPCYNQADFLSESLESVRQQTYESWECIIINDGSTDTTEAVAKDWVQKDKRFKLISIPNGGLANARNTGIKEATGTYILPLDADDKIASEYLKLGREAFQKDPTLKVVYCKAEKFGAVEETWDLKDYSLEKLAFSNMIFCSAFFKKTDWEKVGGYDVNMKYGLEDWEFWIAILKHGGMVKRLDYIGFFYRIQENSMLQSMTKTQEKELFDYMSIKHADFYVADVGNFQDLANERYKLQKKYKSLFKSRKHAINVLCYTLFRWRPFRLKNENLLNH